MKAIKPFFLGTLGGLAMVAGLLVGLYYSPLRETVYFSADPEMAQVRSRLIQYRDWMSQTDLHIMEKGPKASDSLRTAQVLAWQEYKKWRAHLGELARAHTRPTAAGFWSWTYSLRYWVIPIGVFLVFLPPIWMGWRLRRRFLPSRLPIRSKAVGNPAQRKAMSSFQDAVSQIARITDQDRKESQTVGVSEEKLPPTTPINIGVLPDLKASHEPETKSFALIQENGLESSFSSGLSMEDEDGESDGEESLSVMPPTTEVELVERRRGEVLKLARKGLTSSEISRRLRLSQDQVEFIIRLRREKG